MMMTNIFSCFRVFQFFSLQRTRTSFEKGPLETNVASHIFPMINFNWSRRNFEILSHFNFDTHTIQTNVGRSQFSQNHVLDTFHKSYLSCDNFLGRNFSWWFDEDDKDVEKYLAAPSTMFLLTDLTGVFPISIISLVSLLSLRRLVQGSDCFLNWCFENRDAFFG